MMAKRAKHSKGVCSEEEVMVLTVGDKLSSADRISELQDDLLLILLNQLTFKEATATSILCRRWRYLWTFTPKLHFDGSKSLLKLRTAETEKDRLECLEEERCKFVRWVDHALASHKGSAIEEFRVIFDLDTNYEESIEEWLRFVLARKVQNLELNLLNDISWYGSREDESYTFPYRLLFSDGSCDFKYLKKLSINDVNVNGEALEELLVRKCPLLEHLSVSESRLLTTLKIVGPFPSLKYIEIRWNDNLKSVEIRDANLVGLTYVGSRIELILENVPLLVEMLAGGDVTEKMQDIILMFSRYLPRLEIFSISCRYYFNLGDTELFYSTVKMSKLKQLRLLVAADDFFDDDYSLMWVTNLIRASPCLERFVLEVLHESGPPKFDFRKLENIVTPHVHLKEVKFVGYCGRKSDFELVMHFLNNSPSLEKLVVDPSQPFELLPLPYDFLIDSGQSADKIIEDERKARRRAKKQFSYVTLPPRIDFQIL